VAPAWEHSGGHTDRQRPRIQVQASAPASTPVISRIAAGAVGASRPMVSAWYDVNSSASASRVGRPGAGSRSSQPRQ